MVNVDKRNFVVQKPFYYIVWVCRDLFLPDAEKRSLLVRLGFPVYRTTENWFFLVESIESNYEVFPMKDYIITFCGN